MQSDPVQEALNSLKAAKADYQRKLENIENAIFALEGNSVSVNNNPVIKQQQKYHGSNYDAKWGLATKFLYVLKNENRFLHFREAGEIISSLDGKGDPKELGAKLSSSTSKLKKNGTIVKVQPTGKNQDTFWGSPKWLNEDGSIKDGHEFNEGYLASHEDRSQPLFEI